LYPHLLWLATLGTGNKVLMVLFFTLCDCLAFVVGDRLLSRDRSAQVVTLYRILYVLCPLSWFLVVGFGQEEPVLALLGELTLFASLASLDVWGGILVGVALAVTKSMFGVYAYVAWLVSRRKVVFLATAILATVLLHYSYVLRGVIPFPFREYHNSPPSVNIWTVLFPNPPGSAISFWVFPLLLLVVALCSFIYAHQQFKPKATVEGISILILANFLAFMLFSPKSLQPYRLVFIPFLFMYMASRIASKRSFVYMVALYSLALSVHYTFWEDWVYRYGYFDSIQGILVYVMLCVAVAVEVIIFVDVLRRLISGMRGFTGRWAC
jgi:hypothetical protein